eukprot:4939992-Prymnesium_polylepis.1
MSSARARADQPPVRTRLARAASPRETRVRLPLARRRSALLYVLYACGRVSAWAVVVVDEVVRHLLRHDVVVRVVGDDIVDLLSHDDQVEVTQHVEDEEQEPHAEHEVDDGVGQCDGVAHLLEDLRELDQPEHAQQLEEVH